MTYRPAHGRHVSDDDRAAIRRALEADPYIDGRSLAQRLGLPERTVWRIRRKLRESGHKPAIHARPEREVRDAAFWKSRAQDEHKRRMDAEHMAEMLAGIRNTNVTIPEWLIPTTGTKGRSVIGCLISDVHMGEKIDPDEILGINAFDEAICAARLKRYFEAACVVGSRWSSDTTCEGVLLALAGDLVSGDIHEELRVTNTLTAHEQVWSVAANISGGIKLLARAFGRVHVIGVPGNHGRTTHKPTAKLASRLSYDMAAVRLIADQFANDNRVTFQFSHAIDQITPVFGRSVFTTHGDRIGTKGGMGFAGPNLPIIRGAMKVEAQQARLDRRPDLIQFGHYHTSTNPGIVLGNGSVPGYSEYGNGLRAAAEPPGQWLYLLHSKWWLRERAVIQLEDPETPAKPVVRIPARMAA